MANNALAALLGGALGEVYGLVEDGLEALGLKKPSEVAAQLRRQLAARLPLPENHDLVRGIRTAHLAALDHVARAQARLLEALPPTETTPAERDFARWLRAWLDERLNRVLTDIDVGAVTAEEVRRVLDDMVHPSETEGFTAQATASRAAAETAALAELQEEGRHTIPPRFAEAFRAPGGWYDVFALFVNEEIKTNECFRSIFLAAELVDLKRLIGAVEGRIAEALAAGVQALGFRLDNVEAWLRERLDRIEGKIDTLAAALPEQVADAVERRLAGRGVSEPAVRVLGQQIAELAAENALTRAAVTSFLADMDAAGAEPADFPARFRQIVERYRALTEEVARRTNLPAELEAERARAATALREGRLDEADAIVRGLEARLARRRQERREAWEQDCRDEAAVKAERAALAKTRLRYREAAALHAEAAALLAFDTEASRAALMEAASALGDHGREFGDNDALREAIATYGRALALAPRERVPLDWATTQNNLGNALQRLGAREAGTARLEEAVAAYRAALEERTRARVPLGWATTQNNLGTALRTLGAREAGTARLEEAVAAYRAALEEWTRERVPLDWAMTQNNLGNALQRLGAREAGTELLEEAVAAYRAALEETTRERVPLDWAGTQTNLGNALSTLGAREAGTARLEDAVAAYRAALEEMTRARVPLDWAATQNNLGTALRTLGAREAGTARLEEAVAAYRAALEERTRERVPLDWATTQNNLGNALSTLGEREAGTARLEEAVAAYRAALEERTRERVPLDWAGTQTNLGNALQTLGEREAGTARLEEAVAAYRAALEEWTRERVPLQWATTQNNLGTALSTLGAREAGTARLEEAVAAYRAALEEWTRERVPLQWATTQNNLGGALQTLGAREAGTARLEEAAAAYRAALEERTRERVPLDWASTVFNTAARNF